MISRNLSRPRAERLVLRNGGELWQADHIKPLIEAEGRLEYFTVENLQTLCSACHLSKGAEDKHRRGGQLPLPPLTQVPIRIWEGCYGKSWKGQVPDEVFKHPAKFSFLLVDRIYRYALDIGAIRPGEIVGDPFGGVALGGWMARRHGLQWVGMELEPHFHLVGCKVLASQEDRQPWKQWPTARLLLGDSRDFAAGVAADDPANIGHLAEGSVGAILTSPTYAESLAHGAGPDTGIDEIRGGKSLLAIKHGYGDAEANIGSLKEGTVGAIVGSPPFTQCHGGGKGINVDGHQDGDKGIGGRHYQGDTGDRSEANIERLVHGDVAVIVSSPAYGTSNSGNGGLNHLPAKDGQQGGRANGESQTADPRYGDADGQLAKLPVGTVEAVVGSPPYENTPLTAESNTRSDGQPTRPLAKDNPREGYGASEGQIGKTNGETYWAAVAKVYRSCFEALRPGGYVFLVCKDYSKNWERVPLCDNTQRLMEHVGFVTVERIHALLVHPRAHHKDMFHAHGAGVKPAQPEPTETTNKSFYKRTYEKKPRAIKIDWEEVLVFRKPSPIGPDEPNPIPGR